MFYGTPIPHSIQKCPLQGLDGSSIVELVQAHKQLRAKQMQIRSRQITSIYPKLMSTINVVYKIKGK